MSKQKEPVPMPQPASIVLREDRPHFLIPRPHTPLTSCPTSIDLSTDWGKAQLMAATGVPDLAVTPDKPLRIEVVGYLVYPDMRPDDDTGEIKEFIRTILICADGQTFGSTSEVILKRLQAMLQLWPSCPWSPPLVCNIVCRVGRRNGRMFHDLRVEPRV